MNVILTNSCCGKTTLEKMNTKYVDLDIFVNAKTKRQISFIKDFIDFYSNNKKDYIYLININQYIKYNLLGITNFQILDIILPSPEMYQEMEERFKKRDIETYGVVRTPKLPNYIKQLKSNYNLAQQIARENNIEVHYLHPGQYLSDYLLFPSGQKMPRIRHKMSVLKHTN